MDEITLISVCSNHSQTDNSSLLPILFTFTLFLIKWNKRLNGHLSLEKFTCKIHSLVRNLATEENKEIEKEQNDNNNSTFPGKHSINNDRNKVDWNFLNSYYLFLVYWSKYPEHTAFLQQKTENTSVPFTLSECMAIFKKVISSLHFCILPLGVLFLSLHWLELFKIKRLRCRHRWKKFGNDMWMINNQLLHCFCRVIVNTVNLITQFKERKTLERILAPA